MWALSLYCSPSAVSTYHHLSTNTEGGARLDIRAQNVSDKRQRRTYFHVRVFNSHAPSNCMSSTDACYRRYEQEKRSYEKCILEVEHGTFTPLVWSSSGGCGPSATVALKRLAGLISEKHGKLYSSALSFMRCRLSFSLLNSAVACLRAPRSAYHAPARQIDLHNSPLDLIHAEAQLCD